MTVNAKLVVSTQTYFESENSKLIRFNTLGRSGMWKYLINSPSFILLSACFATSITSITLLAPGKRKGRLFINNKWNIHCINIQIISNVFSWSVYEHIFWNFERCSCIVANHKWRLRTGNRPGWTTGLSQTHTHTQTQLHSWPACGGREQLAQNNSTNS